MIVPFNNVFKEEKQNVHLKPSTAIKKVQAKYKAEQNLVGEFYKQALVYKQGAKTYTR